MSTEEATVEGAAARVRVPPPGPPAPPVIGPAPSPVPIPEFDHSRPEMWEAWHKKLESFFRCQRILDPALRRDWLLASCGVDTIDTIQSLVSPQEVETVDYGELVRVVTEHFAPQPTTMTRRLEFYDRLRKPAESAAAFLTELRRLARRCQFPSLNETLLDRFVAGQTDIKLRRKLAAQKELNLEKALEMATAAELAAPGDSRQRGAQFPAKQFPAKMAVHRESASESSDEEEGEVCRIKPKGGKRASRAPGTTDQWECAGCGGNHQRSKCRFRDALCRRCSRKGHIERVCRAPKLAMSPMASRRSTTKAVQEECHAVTKCRCPARLTIGRAGTCKKIHVTVQIEGAPCEMEVDTGSALSLISWSTLKRLVPRVAKRQLDSHHLHLTDYQGNPIPIVGVGRFRVTFKAFSGPLKIVVVEGNRPSLLGLDWFGSLGLEVAGINSVSQPEVEGLFKEFPDVFDGTLGEYVGSPISFNLDPNVAPIRLKPRRVPFALRARVDEQLDKLIAQGVLEPVDHAAWETPIVTPVKPDGSVRICADYKCTINKALQQHAYPVPVVNHLLHSLGEGKVFAKLDLAQAYQQLPVTDATAEAQTIVTHRGAFRCRRLQFGVSVAPGLFQSLMERLLQGLPGVVPYFDDVLVSAESSEQLFDRLRAVLTRFQEAGLKVKRDKCKFAVPRVEFLGYMIDGSGIHPTDAKVQAIQQAPTPRSKRDLQAFLGLLNFYNMFLPHKATVAEPLHRLLAKDAPWVWGAREAAAFRGVKQLLSSDAVLVQYSETRPLVLACDASPFGIGAVLSHVFPDGREAPIAYFSRTLSPAERNYSQLDKEALALVAGVKRFHEYLYGRAFMLVTDHKPLLGLLAGDSPTPAVLSPRMVRWTVFLAAYQYKLVHRPGTSLGNADALSRCPLPDIAEDPAPASAVFLIEELPEAPVSATDVAACTSQDRLLRRVRNWVLRGWPKSPPEPEFQPFFTRQHELSINRGCLLWGDRVVIPARLRQRVLEALHVAHPGIVRMKGLARGYMWWPKMDEAIATWVESCRPCQESRPDPPVSRGNTWETPRAPWSRIHIDLAGPFHNRMFMVVVDAYSKWLEVALLTSTTSEAIIKVLRGLFATHGVPDVLVSDNGPQFTSGVFERYLLSLGTRHALTAPFHPASNGQAERMVRSAKESLGRLSQPDWHERVAEYLLAQHVTPCTATGRSPAELLMGRRLRSPLDRLHPDSMLADPVASAVVPRAFAIGDKVFARNYAGEVPWVQAVVVGITGPKSYQVALDCGRIWRRNIDQLRRRSLDSEIAPGAPTTVAAESRESMAQPLGGTEQLASDTAESAPAPAELNAEVLPEPVAEPDEPSTEPSSAAQTPEVPAAAPPEPRRSNRARRRPAYLKDYIE